MGDDDVVRCEVADRVATVTIDRPAVRNALNGAVLEQLGRLVRADIVSNDQAGVRRMRQTYAEGARGTGADAWALEADVARSWRASGGGASDEVERRRAAIIERGRSQ